MTRKVLTSLRAALSEAVDRERVPHNVARDVKLPRNRRADDERIIPTKEEIRKMIEACPERHRPLIVTAIFTGMRISELRGLTWDDVDVAARLIHVRQRADRFNALGKPKSRSSRRSIPMAPIVAATLDAWRPHCPSGAQGLVFPNGKGNIENHANIHHRVFVPLLVENGIVDASGAPRFSFHALRESFRAFVRDRVPADCTVEFTNYAGSRATVFDVTAPMFQQTKAALTDEWNKDAAFIGSGGSIPVTNEIVNKLGMPVVMVGFGLADDRIHSPNEKYDLRSFQKGVRSWARVLAALAQ
jgi:hypothetical protein